MKWIYRVLATGPWAGGTVRNLEVPADSPAEAESIVRASMGAWSAKSFGHRGPFTDPSDLSLGRPSVSRGSPFSSGWPPSGTDICGGLSDEMDSI
jgi:hypothetical protein